MFIVWNFHFIVIIPRRKTFLKQTSKY